MPNHTSLWAGKLIPNRNWSIIEIKPDTYEVISFCGAVELSLRELECVQYVRLPASYQSQGQPLKYRDMSLCMSSPSCIMHTFVYMFKQIVFLWWYFLRFVIDKEPMQATICNFLCACVVYVLLCVCLCVCLVDVCVCVCLVDVCVCV